MQMDCFMLSISILQQYNKHRTSSVNDSLFLHGLLNSATSVVLHT